MALEVIHQQLDSMSVHEMLAIARAAATRDGQPELSAAIHAVLLLDLSGKLADLAPIVASVRKEMTEALGNDPRAVN